MKFLKKHWLLFLSLILILPSLLPLFRPGFFRMHDWIHVARLAELDLALKAGQIPPRWAPDFGWGYGMPLFHFYSPLPYYLAELLYLIKIPAIWAIKAVFALNFFAGFYFMYLWAKSYWGKLGALIAATGFVYLPYRAVDFYVRGTLGELTAMTFLPLFFYSASQYLRRPKKPFLLLYALSLTGIFLSHNPTTLFALFFLPLFCLWELIFLVKSKGKKIILPIKLGLKLILASLLAVAGSTFFLLPAFLEQNFTIVPQIANGFFHYSLHFIYLRQLFSRSWAYGGSVLGPHDEISFQLGLPQVFLAVLAGLIFLQALKNKQKRLISHLSYLGFALLVSVFLMTFHAQFIWDKLPFIQITQFPWRLLVFSGTFIAFLSGAVAKLFTKKKFLLPLTIGIVLSIILFNVGYFKPDPNSDNWHLYTTDRQIIKTEVSDALFDYLPIAAKKPPQPAMDAYQTTAQIDNFDSQIGRFHFTSNASQSAQFLLSQFYFPGWQAKIDHQSAPLQPGPDFGRLQLILPPGEHQVDISLEKTPLQFWSDIISLVTWLGTAGYFLIKRYA